VKLIYDDKKSIEDLSSGDTPDIFCFFDDNEYNRMLSKGLFTDLYGIFNQDDDFNREEYLTNLFSGLENDGKLYRICPVFDYDTFLGKAKYFEAKKDWTLSEVEALASQQANPLPVFSKKLSREDILKTYTLFLLGKNIDYEKKSVSINHDELSKYLEQFKQHPKGWQGSSMDQEAKQAMLFDYNDPSFYEFHNLEKKICKDELAFVGFPGSEGSKSVFLPKMEFAISKDCKYKDEVWNFIKRFFQEDYQNSEEIMPYLPVKKNAIENRLKAVKRETGLTNLEIDQIMDFLTSLSCVGLDDKQINKIMQEEAERFYRGEQTANEAVSHIQDQIQQYIK
ncbi:MAG: hypothetical protein PWP24_1625, partial [Clostridiales bacterium]|nr:hypothetical protein [Clostridiales bacterium]